MTGTPGNALLQRRVARVLTVGTGFGVALLAVGVAALAAARTSPLPESGAPAATFDPARVVADAATLRPEALIWLGLVVLIATPAARVAASLVGFAGTRDRAMSAVAIAILAVIAAGVLVGGLSG